MKKLFYLLLALPMVLGLASCSDNDLPEVNVNMTFNNVVAKDGSLYAVKDSVISLVAITTRAVDSDKDAAIANMLYYWNGIPAPGLTWSPLPMKIPLPLMPLRASGLNVLGMEATVLEVDKSMANCYIRVPIVTVDKAEDLPDGAQPGLATYTIRIRQYDD